MSNDCRMKSVEKEREVKDGRRGEEEGKRIPGNDRGFKEIVVKERKYHLKEYRRKKVGVISVPLICYVA